MLTSAPETLVNNIMRKIHIIFKLKFLRIFIYIISLVLIISYQLDCMTCHLKYITSLFFLVKKFKEGTKMSDFKMGG
jgi:uncharacterized membrane protein